MSLFHCGRNIPLKLGFFIEVKMFKNKRDERGLSTIVVTLIMILISLVAVGIVWVVVRNLISGGTAGVEISAKCLNVVIEPTKVNCSDVDDISYCDITLKRTGTGSDEIGGVKLVFRNSESGASSNLINLDGNIEPLVGKTETGINTNVNGADVVEVTAFFKDASGNEQICSQTGSFEF
jgi:hypothetical protein